MLYTGNRIGGSNPPLSAFGLVSRSSSLFVRPPYQRWDSRVMYSCALADKGSVPASPGRCMLRRTPMGMLMTGFLRIVAFLLLAISQIALGPSAGRVVCFGSIAHATASDRTSCSHGGDHEGVHLPAPVEPHDEEQDDCPCVDSPVPVGTTDHARKGATMVRDAAVLAVLPVPLIFLPRRAPVQRASRDPRPPDRATGLRTIRLLI